MKNRMILFKGDTVKLKSGVVGEVVDTWGVVRDWCKVRLDDSKIDCIMTTEIDSIVTRARDKNTKTWWGKVKKN